MFYNDFKSGSIPASFKISPIGVVFAIPNASDALTSLFFILRNLSDACIMIKQIGNVTPNKKTTIEPSL